MANDSVPRDVGAEPEDGGELSNPPRVLLFMESGRDRELLDETLSEEYRVETTTDVATLETDFDCCVFDYPEFNRVAGTVQSRRDTSSPTFLPYVLLVSEEAMDAMNSDAWGYVDAVIELPVDRKALRTRIRNLVERRRTAAELAERERRLERQADQMEFFNSILRHDVLNAVTVIKSRAEFLTEDLQGEQLRYAETIVRWSDDVKEIVQQVRTVLVTLTGSGDPHLEPVDLGSELRSEIERVRSTYPGVSFDTAIPDTVLVRANDLLGDVLGNIVTNAIEHNDTDGLHVSITVRETDEWVVVRIADNGRGVSDDRKEAIFRREGIGHAKSTGSGFGLFFVDVMVDESGGDVWVEDNDDGGATFVVRLPASNNPTRESTLG